MDKMWTLRIDSGELEGWRRAAEADGLSLSAWVRRACGEQVALGCALVREAEANPAPFVDTAGLLRERAHDLAGKFKPYPRG